jgi:hypothetical protein
VGNASTVAADLGHSPRTRAATNVWCILLVLVSGACADPKASSRPDAALDAGDPDAALRVDAGDAGDGDASARDAGDVDADTRDAGDAFVAADADVSDAGTRDADVSDAGTRDADTPDATSIDAGPPVVCGDGRVEGAETCDDGTNAGTPGECARDCSALAPTADAFPVYLLNLVRADGSTTTVSGDAGACAATHSAECADFCVEDADHCAGVAYLGHGEWALSLRVKPGVARAPLLVFPHDRAARPLGDPTDDVFYYPWIGGIAERAENRDDPNRTFAATYPGGTFAPITMLADGAEARLVHASNWPPIAVSPRYGGGRLTLAYQDAESTPIGGGSYLDGWSPGLQSTPLPGEQRTYRFVEVNVAATDVPAGMEPWQVAVDAYRAWLDVRRGPLPDPSPLVASSHGFVGVQLENLVTFDPDAIRALSRAWRRDFPWMLLWGQMTDYLGDCCLSHTELGPRYADLPTLARELDAAGQRVGYYTSPQWEYVGDPAYKLDRETGLAWLFDWIAANERAGATAHYIDTLARVPWGSPDVVRELFAATGSCDALRARGLDAYCGRIPHDVLIEGAVDVYPAAGLLDGSLSGVPVLGLASSRLEPTRRTPFVAFPRLAFYLLREHVLHLGGYNSDFPFAGTYDTDGDGDLDGADDPAQWYWAEQQAFLLGARITGSHLEVDVPGVGRVPNPRLLALIAERERVDFFGRRARYRDRIGLTSIPPDVVASRFVDRDGRTLVAVSNPTGRSGLTIAVDGVAVPVCAATLSLVDPAAPRCP